MAIQEKESPSSSSSRTAASNTGGNSRSRSKNGGDAFYLAKTVLKGSAIIQAVRGHFRSVSSYDIVFGKETSIELVKIDEYGIAQNIAEQSVFGTIKDIAVLPWKERSRDWNPEVTAKDMLLVISDSGKLSFLSFSNEMNRFLSIAHVQLSGPGNVRNQVGRMLAVHSTGSFVAASAYEDQLAIFSLSRSISSDIIDKKILCPAEKDGRLKSKSGFTSLSGTIWSMCFISKECSQPNQSPKSLLAILLNRSGSFYRNELLLLEWDMEEQVIHVLYQFAEAWPLAYHVVEVPESRGFALLFRAGDIVLMDFRDVSNPSYVYRTALNSSSLEESKYSNSTRIPDIMDEEGMYSVAASALLELGELNKNDDPMNVDDYSSAQAHANYVCSWSWEAGSTKNPRIILSVDSGDIYAMEMCFESGTVLVNLSDSLYKGLPSNALVWLESGMVAAIFDMADGAVLKFEDGFLRHRSSIQNIAPILDMCIANFLEEKDERIFACSGLGADGSLRIIRNGISVENLLKTDPVYQGVAGTWTLKMNASDAYHSFLVISFVEQTRVLSVGVNFCDVTEAIGFHSDVCTLACGTVSDGVLVQIHQFGVRVCLPISKVHPGGIPLSCPETTAWNPNNMTISLGAVGHGVIVVGTSSPSFLCILGIKSSSLYKYNIFQMHCVKLQNELSCISIPQLHLEQNKVLLDSVDKRHVSGNLHGVLFVIGTHRPSVEVLSFTLDKGIQVHAVGITPLTNNEGTSVGGCVPQDVRLVVVDRVYILSGLRNGMLLRFEWPNSSPFFSTNEPCQYDSHALSSSSSLFELPKIFTAKAENEGEKPVGLQLIACRRIGITPVFLVPLCDSLDADMIVLSDRPWLLKTARHSLSYTSISFQPSIYVTPVSSFECPTGILFVAESCLHLVEMVPSKRINVQTFHLGGTPRNILYHDESKLLLVMRTELDDVSCSSDICFVSPSSGMVLSSFKFRPGETGKCMELLKVGNKQVLVVGTSLSTGPAIMPSGEAESTKGRLVVLCIDNKQSIHHLSANQQNLLATFGEISTSDEIRYEETSSWNLRLSYETEWPGMVVSVCRYLDRYFLASVGNAFYVCGFPIDNSQKVKRLAVGRTRFAITTLTAHSLRIAVGDCRDGILFYSYHEDSRKLEEVFCDPFQRLVADCLLMDVDTAFVSDRKGSVVVMSSANHSEDNASPERNLTPTCSYYLGEISMSMVKGALIPTDIFLLEPDAANSLKFSRKCTMASTLLGSVIVFIQMTKEEYELLEQVQVKLANHKLTSPILGNDHNEFRRRECPPGAPKMLDGDMLAQFLELTSTQQEAVLNTPSLDKLSLKPSKPLVANRVVQILERVHHALS